MAASSKIHLVLRGTALCDYQWRNGGRTAVTSIADFKLLDDEACKECARKLAKLEAARSALRR